MILIMMLYEMVVKVNMVSKDMFHHHVVMVELRVMYM